MDRRQTASLPAEALFLMNKVRFVDCPGLCYAEELRGSFDSEASKMNDFPHPETHVKYPVNH